MKRIVYLLLLFPVLFASCGSEQQDQEILFKNFSIQEEPLNWKKVFTNKYEITPLETTPDCLVGMIYKIKKLSGHYYIASGKNIFHFDERGKFVAALDKQGQGPEEYTRIEDFDVYEINGRTEVWVSDNVSLKIYDATDFSFLRKIPFDFTIYKFRRLDNAHILLVTGQSENILTLTDGKGKILAEYQKKEIPYLMFRSVQFIKKDSRYLFQLGIANRYIAFDTQKETFHKGTFVQDDTFLTDKELLELFASHGTDFIGEALKTNFINGLVFLDEIAWIHTSHSRKNYLTKVENGSCISVPFEYGSVLATVLTSDSDNSLLLFMNPDQLSEFGENLQDKFGNPITCAMDDNPCILEFFNEQK